MNDERQNALTECAEVVQECIVEGQVYHGRRYDIPMETWMALQEVVAALKNHRVTGQESGKLLD